MSMEVLVGVLLALAALVATMRHALRWRRLPAAARPAGWRIAAILLLQPACAALLYATLLPPTRPADGAHLVVMTAGADPEVARNAAREGAVLVALPEARRDADGVPGARAMPDLATARRAYPGAGQLSILGSGLEARDIDAARGVQLAFEPPALPGGLVELQVPPRVATGGPLHVSGRIHEATGEVVELLDPAGVVQDRVRPDGDGRFRLQAPVRASGPALFALRLQVGSGPGPAIPVPVHARPGDGARLLLLAGAPNPELKFLRRWAIDAGLQLHSRMALGGGASLGDAPRAIDQATLAGHDLLVVDERAWSGLGASARDAVLAAVDQGLGLMLRITAPPDADTRRGLRQLGFELGEADPALGAGVALRHRGIPAPAAPDAARAPPSAPADAGTGETLPALARQPHALHAPGSVSLLEDASGRSLARWRPHGRGRIAAWNLDQSFRLVLVGQGAVHARLWSEAVGTLARAAARPEPRFEGVARAGDRAVLCDFAPGSAVVAEDGTTLHPLQDPFAAGCGALWPERSGWHRVGAGEAAPMLYVHPADALPGIAAKARRDATLQLVAGHGPGTQPVTGPEAEAVRPRWPWFIAWLLATALAWWLERNARRRRMPTGTGHAGPPGQSPGA